MAIVQYAAPVAELRGKVGGIVFSATKAGPYVKAWGKGSNPRTQIQTEHRGTLSTFAQAWADITAAQRTAWNVYAALPAQQKLNSLTQLYSVSGFNWFIEININRRAAGQAQLSAAPVLGTPAAPFLALIQPASTGNPSLSRLVVPPGDPSINQTNAIKTQVLNTAGRSSFSPIRTFMLAFNYGVGVRSYFIQTELESHFGTLQIGQTLFAQLQIQNSEGRRGPLSASSAPFLV